MKIDYSSIIDRIVPFYRDWKDAERLYGETGDYDHKRLERETHRAYTEEVHMTARVLCTHTGFINEDVARAYERL